ncbi:MAG: glycosyltransferase [Lachnospiraceae bacterium]|nr:glycosyltransferase [Lachnospiraceae bacterium]
MNKIVSIVVPIYNVDGYLEKCIESIRNQTYDNIQIVLVDDGSTDSSGVICDHFQALDGRIEVVHQENRGLVAARKAGLEICNGDYVGFVDGDDYIDPEMYSNLITYIEETEADIVHSGYFKNDNKDIVWGTVENSICELNVENTDKILHMLMAPINSVELISASIWSKLYKRDVALRAYRIVPDEQSYGEDILFFCNALMQSEKIVIVNTAFYHYVLRNNSITHKIKRDIWFREYSLYKHLLEIFKENPQYRNYIDIMLARNLSFALRKMSGGKVRCYEYPDLEEFINKKVVIYGAGVVGQDIYTQFRLYKDCNIVAWVDKAYNSYDLKYSEIYPIEILSSLDYDVVIIAVSNGNLAMEIFNGLLQMKIDKNKIAWKAPVYTINSGS